MKTDFYLVFPDIDSANAFIGVVDERIGEHWAEAKINRFDGKALVAWNEQYLSKVNSLINGIERLSYTEADESGWNLGFHKGKFAKSKTKLEDAIFARESLDMFDHYPNFPAYRAVFFGILSSLYGVKEGLKKVCKKIGEDATLWWEKKFEEIKNDDLLYLFYDTHNADKHGLEVGFLTPNMELYKYGTTMPEIISGEGAFNVINRGTSKERRVFHTGITADFSCYHRTKNLFHKGDDVSELPLKEQIDLVISHYQELVWEAKGKFDV